MVLYGMLCKKKKKKGAYTRKNADAQLFFDPVTLRKQEDSSGKVEGFVMQLLSTTRH